MTRCGTLDRIARSGDAEQTGVRYEDSHNCLKTTVCMGRGSEPQFVKCEV